MTHGRLMSKLERLFRRHDRLVSALILLILLGTFLAKEYFRDDYRERATAIDTAFPMYVMSQDLDSVREKVEILLQGSARSTSNPQAPRFASSRAKGRPNPNGPLRSNRQPPRSPEQVLKELQDRQRKIGKIYESHSGQDALGMMTSEPQLRLENENEARITRIWFLIDALPNNEVLEKKIRELQNANQGSDGGSLLVAEGKVYGELDGLAEQVRGLANSEYEKAEHRFHIATTFSYFTYALGWLLALLRGVAGTARPEFE